MADLSIIVPIYNEASNVFPLYEKIRGALEQIKADTEIIMVNDGSVDGSTGELDAIAAGDPRVKIIHFTRNFGQTAALMAGINAATGDTLVTIDGDLENDPADIPRLMAKLEEGYDVCSGWRKDRQDAPIRRILPSRVANWLISLITGVRIHDLGCTLKAYRRYVFNGLHLYGEMHRYIPVYAAWQGAKVAEIVVAHHHRTAGKSKYGLERVVKVMLDIIIIRFLDRYSQKPMYVFGTFGLLCFASALAMFGLMVYLKFFGGKSFVETPLPSITVLCVLIGVQSVLAGLTAEILMRTYFEAQNKTPYSIARTRNFDGD
ncbi:MAG: glycosyltransferase family 2 protein [Pseudomonadota bacterium]